MVTIILAVVLLCVGALAMNRVNWRDRFNFSPTSINRWSDLKRFFSYAFLHWDYGHLVTNLAFLLVFGWLNEKQFNDSWQFMAFITFAIPGAMAAHLVDRSNINTIGFSGVNSAIITNYFTHDVEKTISIGSISVPAYWYAAAFIAVHIFERHRNSKRVFPLGAHNYQSDNVAHISGCMYGLLFNLLANG